MKRVIAVLVGLSTIWLCAGGANAALVNVDFCKNVPSGYNGSYSGAAVIGSAGDTWNVTPGTTAKSTSPLNLVDAGGGNTGISMTWAADQGSGVISNWWNALMNDYLLINAGTSTKVEVALSGIEAGVYDLYLYGGTCETSGGALPKWIELSLVVDGTAYGSVSLESVSTEYDFVEGANYGVIPSIRVGSGDILTITGVNKRTDKTAAFNGFQLASVAVPEPSSMLLVLAGAIALLPHARRKRK